MDWEIRVYPCPSVVNVLVRAESEIPAVVTELVAPDAVIVGLQLWAQQRMFPYFYSAMSYLVWVVLLVNSADLALGARATSRQAVESRRQQPFVHRNQWPRATPRP